MRSTQEERISGIARRAATHRDVIDDVATRVTSARAWTRIHAILIDARLGAGTLGIHCAFRSAVRVRVAKVVGETSAYTFVARRIGSAR